MDKLFTPFKVGDTELVNRVVMAPMTRSRATVGDTADELTAKYYQQRASAGLIITEGSQISVQGRVISLRPASITMHRLKGGKGLRTRSTTRVEKSTFSSGMLAVFLTLVCRMTGRHRSVQWQ